MSDGLSEIALDESAMREAFIAGVRWAVPSIKHDNPKFRSDLEEAADEWLASHPYARESHA